MTIQAHAETEMMELSADGINEVSGGFLCLALGFGLLGLITKPWVPSKPVCPPPPTNPCNPCGPRNPC